LKPTWCRRNVERAVILKESRARSFLSGALGTGDAYGHRNVSLEIMARLPSRSSSTSVLSSADNVALVREEIHEHLAAVCIVVGDQNPEGRGQPRRRTSRRIWLIFLRTKKDKFNRSHEGIPHEPRWASGSKQVQKSTDLRPASSGGVLTTGELHSVVVGYFEV
jgi:hypothetical protein